MIVTGHINFFSINECGLYKQGSDKPHDLKLVETLSLVAKWFHGKPLTDTLPWAPDQTKTGLSKCYCRDLYHDEESGEYLFVLWKSDTDAAGSLLGAPEDQPAGKGTVVEYTNNYQGNKVIWGRPCYYWFIPNQNIVASIKFDHSVCDSNLMQEWMLRVMTNKIDHPTKRKERTESGQVRFSYTDKISALLGRFSYRFSAKLIAIDTASSELAALASRVVGIIHRETIRLDKPKDERARWLKLFDHIEYLNPKPQTKTRQIEIRAEAKPTVVELKRIIEKFAKENRKRSEWDNVGFQTEDGAMVWADRYRLHEQINMNQESTKVFAAAELHERLSKNRARLLKGLTAAKKPGVSQVAKSVGQSTPLKKSA
ncbi:hypothetical protein [Paucibacter sp. Y2R2-4]|uniref:hypothetical protein n=1 Tax=Paucibacter sp. Y2R2-4 TaxID=2893553 RepID=UPI0021E47738|nr:hypothetical protein [Paucibacter sp. Y2R2-4]MCV2350444.1 hypothetical protein [Paucibacter sp. Y2R2-4]